MIPADTIQTIAFRRPTRHGALVLACACALAGCGGGSTQQTVSPPAADKISGSISGLTGSGLVLSMNGQTVSPGANDSTFSFPTPLSQGTSYSVAVSTQPSGESCQIANASGTAGSGQATISVTCTAVYTVAGTVSNLAAGGLVLTDGTDTVSPSSGATSFALPTEFKSGTAYSVSVNTQPSGETCDVDNSSGTINLASITNVAVRCGLWSWMAGSNASDSNGDVTNVPSARGEAAEWNASATDTFVFGGFGVETGNAIATGHPSALPGNCVNSQGPGELNDLWEYSANGGTWTYVGGTGYWACAGSYGTQGTAASTNWPGGREGAVTWVDSAGALWLFGGYGYDSSGKPPGLLNDLWRFDPNSGEWTWVAGSSTAGASGSYGSPGVASAFNEPPARESSSAWIDASGNLWLFGGGANPDAGSGCGGLNGVTPCVSYNDLWKFTVKTGKWTWMGGSSGTGAVGLYGQQGVAASSNMPGARFQSTAWTDASGNFWMFGGDYAQQGTSPAAIPLNDLWKYDPSSGEWTWMSGSASAGASGVYGSTGVPAASNAPGARAAASGWLDEAGNLWLFGGSGLDSSGSTGYLNDLWMYDPATSQWVWMAGSSVVSDPGDYGRQGSPAIGNVPPSRSQGISWIDAHGDLWLLGGLNSNGFLNDLWEYSR